ncbi:MAG: hypothetical protein QW514_06600 [Thermoprotei archaeon]
MDYYSTYLYQTSNVSSSEQTEKEVKMAAQHPPHGLSEALMASPSCAPITLPTLSVEGRSYRHVIIYLTLAKSRIDVFISEMLPTPVERTIINLVKMEYMHYGNYLQNQVFLEEFTDNDTGDSEFHLKLKTTLNDEDALKLWDNLSKLEGEFINTLGAEEKMFFYKYFSLILEW